MADGIPGICGNVHAKIGELSTNILSRLALPTTAERSGLALL